MLPSRGAAQAGSDMSWASSAIEVLPKRLYFGSFRFLPPESSSVHLFCIDDSLVYEPFYAVSAPPAPAAACPSRAPRTLARSTWAVCTPPMPLACCCKAQARACLMPCGRYRYCQLLKEKLASEQHKDKKIIHYCNRLAA